MIKKYWTTLILTIDYNLHMQPTQNGSNGRNKQHMTMTFTKQDCIHLTKECLDGTPSMSRKKKKQRMRLHKSKKTSAQRESTE